MNNQDAAAESKHIGFTLKAAREAQGVTTEEVAQATRIKASYLQAIENEQYEILPKGPYGVAYIQAYADFLNLDGDKLATVYRLELADQADVLPYQRILVQSRYNRSSLRAWLSFCLFIAILLTYGAVYYFRRDTEGNEVAFNNETSYSAHSKKIS